MRTLLLFLSRREGLKNFLLRFKFFKDTAWRFVAGEHLEDALRVTREANHLGLYGTLDLLGEYVHSREQADRAKVEVLDILAVLHREKLNCSVSVKLTQLGLELDTELSCRNLYKIVEKAHALGNFVRVDMEGSETTDRTLDLIRRIRGQYDNVGAVIQSYLYRSIDDVGRLLEHGVSVRLCKGAYAEPDTIAFRRKRDTDISFLKIMKMLLLSKIYHGIATHDERMIEATKRHAREQGISRESFELQMLYGVRRDLQKALVREVYRVRIYIPYGRAWYPYFMRRLGERPANLWFIARNLLRQ
jgi:proline dehydrogenase